MSVGQEPNQPDLPEFDFSNPNAEPDVELHPDSLADGFLKDIDPNDRPIVEKYIKNWDGNVTKKFQSIHEQYAPYKDLGDYEELVALANMGQQFNIDPIGTLNKIVNTYRELGIDMSQFDYGDAAEAEEVEYEEAEQPWSPSKDDWEQMQQFVMQLGQHYVGSVRERELQNDKMEFDGFLDTLHTEHGDFDNDWVTGKIANGVDPDEAVQQFQQMIESRVNSRTGRPAPNLFGGGGTPGQVKDVDVKNLSPEQRRAYIAAKLTRAAAEG
jgi:hypothetical protein